MTHYGIMPDDPEMAWIITRAALAIRLGWTFDEIDALTDADLTTITTMISVTDEAKARAARRKR